MQNITFLAFATKQQWNLCPELNTQKPSLLFLFSVCLCTANQHLYMKMFWASFYLETQLCFNMFVARACSLHLRIKKSSALTFQLFPFKYVQHTDITAYFYQNNLI